MQLPYRPKNAMTSPFGVPPTFEPPMQRLQFCATDAFNERAMLSADIEWMVSVLRTLMDIECSY